MDADRDGRVSVAVEVADLPLQVFGPPELSVDPPVSELTFELQEPGRLEGRVLTAEGRSAAGITVLACPGWNVVYRAVTDSEGHYRMVGLPPGR